MKRYRLVWIDAPPNGTWVVGETELAHGFLEIMVRAMRGAGLVVLAHPEIEGPNPGSLTPYDWGEIEWVDE